MSNSIAYTACRREATLLACQWAKLVRSAAILLSCYLAELATGELLLNSCYCRLAVALNTVYTEVPQTAWNALQTLRLILWLRLCLKNTAMDWRQNMRAKKGVKQDVCA